MRRALGGRAVAAAATLAAVLAVAAPAKPAADDVSIQVFLETGNLMTRTNGLEFRIRAEAESTSGVQQAITIRIALPDGLRWGTDGPDPTEGCTGTAPAACSTVMTQNPVGTIGTGYVWDVVANRTGTYEITASVEPTEADPDLANNSDTFRFEVVAGGGGGGGGGGGTSVIASAAKLSPTPIRAGSIVTASVRIVLGGTLVRPTRVTCAGTIGGTKVRGAPKATRGKAACTYRTSRAAKGKTLRGSVAFTARGERYVRRFAAKLR
jgi:hypothetical protein